MNEKPLFLPHKYKALLYWGLWTPSTSYFTTPEYKKLCPSSCISEVWSLYKSTIFVFKPNFYLQRLWILTATQTQAVQSFRWISLISFLYEFIYLAAVLKHVFVPVSLISTANPKRLWRPRVGIDQFKSQKPTFCRSWTNRHKAQSRK